MFYYYYWCFYSHSIAHQNKKTRFILIHVPFALKNHQNPHIESETASLSCLRKYVTLSGSLSIIRDLKLEKLCQESVQVLRQTVNPNPLAEQGANQTKSGYNVNSFSCFATQDNICFLTICL